MIKLKINIPDDFYKEEIRSGFTVTKKRKELWAVELDLLMEFERVCRKHGLKYAALGGSLLGAVRHGGFIPWDDDIDLMMLREEYEKLCEIGPSEFRDPFFFQTSFTDPGTIRGHAQLRNSRTTAIRTVEYDKRYTFNQGIFIDIFPMDRLPDNNHEKAEFLHGIEKRRRNLVRASKVTNRYTDAVRAQKHGIKKLLYEVLHYFGTKADAETYFNEKYESYMKKYKNEPVEKVGLLSLLSLGERCHFSLDTLSRPYHYVPFEFLSIPIPDDYEQLLETEYGNWRVFEIGTSVHGELYVDTHLPYTDYLENRLDISNCENL